jgi:surfeit locus 1 family protein
MSGVAAPDGRSPWRLVVVLAAALTALVILLGLGTWQVQRLHWKENLLATIAERIASQPHSLSDTQARMTTTGDVDYWPVSVGGVFRHEGERHFFATHDGQSGYFVYTPLEIDEDRFVFVNRGFVPFDRKDPASRDEGQIEGWMTVGGLARNPLTEKPSWILPDNEPARNIFYWKDLQAMAASSGVGTPDDYVSFFVDANDAPNPGGLPVGGVTMVSLPNSHLQYAVTWYGLAGALCGVVGVWLWRHRSASGRPGA